VRELARFFSNSCRIGSRTCEQSPKPGLLPHHCRKELIAVGIRHPLREAHSLERGLPGDCPRIGYDMPDNNP
jgi:hypothetical protein